MQSNIPEGRAFFAAPECDICKRQDETVRVVSLPYVVSVLVMTFRRAFAGTYCRKHRRLYLALASLITATVGWLGIPFGFVLTPFTLFQLALGGSSDAETNARLQELLARRKLLSGDTAGAARCLEESLRYQDSPEVRQRLSELYRTLPADLAADTNVPLRQALGIVSVFAVAVLLGLVVGLFNDGVNYLLSPFYQNSDSIFVIILSWLPLVFILFFGILGLRSLVGAVLTRGRIGSRPLALGLAASASALAFYGIAEAETLIRNLSALQTAYAFGVGDLTFALRSLATSGAAYFLINNYTARDLAGLIWVVLYFAAFVLCLFATIKSALQISGWQTRLAQVGSTGSYEPEPGSAWAWGTLAAMLTGALAVVLLLYPGRLSNVEGAITHFKQGMDPADKNDLQGMMREFELASSLWPDSSMTHAGMGMGRMALNDYDGALAELEAALDIGPDAILPNYYMGLVRGERGEFTDAIRALENVVSIEPALTSAYAMLAIYHYQVDEMGQASDELDRAIALLPSSPGSESWIARYFRLSRDFASAEKYMLKALEVDKSPENYLELAHVYTLQGRSVEARKTIEEAEKLGGSQAWIALEWAFRAEQKGSLKEALSMILKALQSQPDDPDLLAELSLLYRRTGQVEKAVQEAEKALQVNSYNVQAHTELAYAYNAQGRLDEAIAEARKAVALWPKSDRPHFILGLSLIEKGMEEEGQKELVRFLDLFYERELVKADRQKALELLGRSD